MEQAYARARALCAQVGETPSASRRCGACGGSIYRGPLPTARELGEQLYRLAQCEAAPTHLLEAHAALGNTLFFLGEFAAARTHLEQGIALTDPAAAAGPGVPPWPSAWVVCLAVAARTLWCLGYPAQARGGVHEALASGPELAHPASLAAPSLGGLARICTAASRCGAGAGRCRLLTLATAQGFALQVGFGTMLAGLGAGHAGPGRRGARPDTPGHSRLQATGQTLARPFCLVLLAEAAGHAGQVEDGLRLLAEALTVLEANSRGRCWEAEVVSAAGRLAAAANAPGCRRRPKPASSRPSTWPVASRPNRWELRAAMSLSRLWQQQGKRAEARELLAPIYGWFTEGFDTADLQEAKALLEELS